jgi:hypothetical protein
MLNIGLMQPPFCFPLYKITLINTGYEVLTAVVVKSSAFWDVF